ncbi:SdpI family protein [Bacillus massiliigorillae]|uniref:SdpI family protein n=1 Tax=Bacillus massiliigorillae TaxID=1243664 RepID=UPI001E33CEC7|nr:SdpI family protein [Bacillus massiliigorillae]
MMKKTSNSLLVLTTVICFLPMILSIVLYNKLPDEIAIHWNNAGEPDNFAPKALAAFGLPILMAAINLVTHFSINTDPKKANSSSILKLIGKWLVPIASVILVPVTLFIAIGYDISIPMICSAMVGIVIIAVGNYLPKCKQSYTVGIRLPWTLNSENNWNKTHRIAGYLWIIGGFALLINSFLNTGILYLTLTIAVLIMGVPYIYSYLLYKKGV